MSKHTSPFSISRRDLLRFGGAALSGLSAAQAFAGQQGHTEHAAATAKKAAPMVATGPKADISLTISEIKAEIGKGQIIRTLAYNGQTPGPLLRMKEGKQVTVDVINQTNDPEMLHWHGFQIPPDVDGSHEEGTPMVQGHSRMRYVFTPKPSGTRWYHTHATAGTNLKIGTYSGQFGMVIVDPAAGDPGRYDQEIPILLHEWNPTYSSEHNMDVDYGLYSINGKMLGQGAPVKVKNMEKVLFRIVNSSATMAHRLALAGHTFRVIALDGNAVPTPRTVSVIELAPGERADAIVEMSNPGVWILGEEDAKQRTKGAGIVIEYQDLPETVKTRAPQWVAPKKEVWDYLAFGSAKPVATDVEARVNMVIEPGTGGYLWALNGKSYPHTDPMMLKPGVKNRLVFDNRTHMEHPVHLHRHVFEITKYTGKVSAGVMKDVVTVPSHQIVEVDLMPAPGPSLFHCHQQFHMDFGFMALMQCPTT